MPFRTFDGERVVPQTMLRHNAIIGDEGVPLCIRRYYPTLSRFP